MVHAGPQAAHLGAHLDGVRAQHGRPGPSTLHHGESAYSSGAEVRRFARDRRSRSAEAIDRLRKYLMEEIRMKGEKVETNDVGETLWECGMLFAMRWAGDPDAELVKQNEAARRR